KASNSMRSEDGRILLMDFGLSQDIHRSSGVAGTLDYMAPELLAGIPPTVQTDIYAMGVLLLYLCTGGYSLPGQGDKAPSSRAVVPSQLEAIIARATHNDPQQRYTSASILREALAATLASAAAPATRGDRARRRFVWIGAAAVLLIAIAVTL